MRKLIAFAPLMLLLAGCTAEDRMPEGTMTQDAGEAVAHNIAAQLVNPQAPAPDASMSYNGERAAQSQDRYVRGQVIPPALPSASSGVSGGNGNSGGAGAGAGAGSGGAATSR